MANPSTTTPVSQVYELCQKMRGLPPTFELSHVFGSISCRVFVVGVGTALGVGKTKQEAKQDAARNFLSSPNGKAAVDDVENKYAWTSVEGKSAQQVGVLFKRRTEKAIDLLEASCVDQNSKVRAQVKSRMEQLTKQIGILLADFKEIIAD